MLLIPDTARASAQPPSVIAGLRSVARSPGARAGALALILLALVEASEFQLIESLAEAVARMVTAYFDVPWLRLRLSKPGAVDAAEDVGVIIEWGERA